MTKKKKKPVIKKEDHHPIGGTRLVGGRSCLKQSRYIKMMDSSRSNQREAATDEEKCMFNTVDFKGPGNLINILINDPPPVCACG